MQVKKLYTFCQRCQMRCKIKCQVLGGKLTKITNLMGIKCPRGNNTMEIIYHPQRLRYPMLKTPVKGGDKWVRVSWEDAVKIMAEKFSNIKHRYGAQSIATVRGSGHKQMAGLSTLLFSHIIGTPNVLDVNEECNVPSVTMSALTTGDGSILFDTGPDYRNSKCILLWGSNPRETRIPHDRQINAALAKGAKVIVVDPRPRINSADIWLRVRPGTDAALALCMINIIIKERLYNEEFVKQWCVGFERLRERVRNYTPEKVSDITWVDKEKIIEAARLFATSRPSCLHLRMGAGGGVYTNVSQTSRAVLSLAAIAGDIDVPGGNLLANRLGGFKDVLKLSYIEELPFPTGTESKRIGYGSYPIIAGSDKMGRYANKIKPRCYAHNASAFKAMQDGDIKAFYVPGANMAVSSADRGLVCRAMNKLEFMVVADLFMTPTAEQADLVLPVATFLETEIPIRAFQAMGRNGDNYVLAPRRIINPVGECLDDREIVLWLAKKMGVNIPWQNIADLNDWLVGETGYKYEEIRDNPRQMIGFPIRYNKYKQRGFNTLSGKVELYSGLLEDLGYDPLPHYREPAQSPVSTPEIAKEYPFILIDRRSRFYTNSEFQYLPSLLKALPDQEVEINPRSAGMLGIKEGDEVFIERPDTAARVRARAKFVPQLHPQVISCLALRWLPDHDGGNPPDSVDINVNTLINMAPPYDPITGNYQVRGLLCRLIKV